MQRNLFAALAGGLFGTGLLISGMTNTLKVQGWLDVFGNWDPTLAFVMGGAIVPMIFAWRLAARMGRSRLGAPLPAAPDPRLGHNLVIGSVLFGMGWGLAGLCPGPALASLSMGGWGGLLFLMAMLAGMLAAPGVRRRIDRLAAKQGDRPMEIRHLTDSYAVSPQIVPEDVVTLKAAGFVRVICNRPDGEIPGELHAAQMRKLVEAAGMEFVDNQIVPGNFSPEIIATQARALAAPGPVFAYCASGNRSSVVWGDEPGGQGSGGHADFHRRPLGL